MFSYFTHIDKFENSVIYGQMSPLKPLEARQVRTSKYLSGGGWNYGAMVFQYVPVKGGEAHMVLAFKLLYQFIVRVIVNI